MSIPVGTNERTWEKQFGEGVRETNAVAKYVSLDIDGRTKVRWTRILMVWLRSASLSNAVWWTNCPASCTNDCDDGDARRMSAWRIPAWFGVCSFSFCLMRNGTKAHSKRIIPYSRFVVGGCLKKDSRQTGACSRAEAKLRRGRLRWRIRNSLSNL